ncbi:MAG: acetate--CoA ligase family protein, partial [Chloroflexi bacterium]|nr:acetate--CoA ligase family protein [Chloroflexota bacterium]
MRLNLDKLLRPRSLALVGISDVGVFGSNLVASLRAHGFPGPLYAVNPSRTEIFGLRSYPSLSDLPEPPDGVMLMVSRARALSVLEECHRLGIRGATIIASGFAESPDPVGREYQDRLARFAREAGIAICGPNCNGFVNAVDRVSCFVGALYRQPPVGGIGLVSQSGATVTAFVDEAWERNLGYTFLVSSGNEAVVDTVDYLEYMLEDERTRVLAAFLESIHRPAAFVDLARRAAEAGKPLIVVKVGRSERGRESALAHTGSLAGSDQAYEAAFRQWGVIRADDVGDLLDRAQFFCQLTSAQLPRGRRLAFMSVSGGAAGLLADLAEPVGVEMPDLPAATERRFRELLPDYATIKNPLDLTGQIHANRARFPELLNGFIEDPVFDGIGVMMHCEAGYEYYLTQMAEAGGRTPKPIALTATAAISMSDWGRAFLETHRVPVVLGLRRFATAFSAAANYRAFRERHGLTSVRGEVRAPCEPASRAPSLPASGGVLQEAATWELLDAYGLPRAASRFVADGAGAVVAAEAIGYPVVLKAVQAGLAHKTEAGGVAVGLRDAEAVQRAATTMHRRVRAATGRELQGYLVQEMVEDGVEAYVGAVHSREFGPLVLAGLGGVFVEVLGDVSMRLAPVNALRAGEMLSELRGRKLLDGVRGRPPADRDAFVEVIQRVSRLAADLGPRLSELDLNPVMVRSEGDGARLVDALVVL